MLSRFGFVLILSAVFALPMVGCAPQEDSPSTSPTADGEDVPDDGNTTD